MYIRDEYKNKSIYLCNSTVECSKSKKQQELWQRNNN